jgi:tartrate/fumarate subfamily iron-sulfur-dependent hydro-lyase beta chain
MTDDEARSLRVGDVLHVSGRLFTARDSAHRLLAECLARGERPPFEPVPDVVYHCGPLAVRDGASWRVLSAGPTSSTRLDPFAPALIAGLGLRLLIGKGGMGERTEQALRQHGAAYAHSTGGAGALAARAITEVEGVFWLEELGMPEAVWLLRVRRFGPLLVAIDSAGGNLYREVAQGTEAARRAIARRMG